MSDLNLETRPWERLETLIRSRDPERLRQYIELLGPAEVARAVARVDPQQREQLVAVLTAPDAAHLVADLPHAQAAALLEHVPAELASAIVSALPSDRRADLLGALPAQRRDEILALLPPQEAREARELGRYPPDSAGGLMIKEFLAYPEHVRARDVIDDLKRNVARYAAYEVQYLYVLSAAGQLAGVVAARRLLFSAPDAALAELMIRGPVAVPADTPLDLLRELFERHPFLAMPVLDADRRMIGVVRRSAVESAIAERAELDHLKSQGIIGGEELRTMPLGVRARRRLSWLVLNIGLNLLAASVIALFQDTLSAVIALAVFLPIISDMSGCSGNQAVAVSMRELALGLVKPMDVARVWIQEIAVGIFNAIVLGLLIAGVAWFWKGNPYLGLVVGVALGVNTLVSVSVGGTLPLLLKRWNVDPAVAAGPILTTITDMCGFFLILSLATLMLPKLVGGAA